MTKTYDTLVCRGSIRLGTACLKCERCRDQLAKFNQPERIDAINKQYELQVGDKVSLTAVITKFGPNGFEMDPIDFVYKLSETSKAVLMIAQHPTLYERMLRVGDLVRYAVDPDSENNNQYYSGRLVAQTSDKETWVIRNGAELEGPLVERKAEHIWHD